MKTCPNCGYITENDKARFCHKCGGEMPESADVMEQMADDIAQDFEEESEPDSESGLSPDTTTDTVQEQEDDNSSNSEYQAESYDDPIPEPIPEPIQETVAPLPQQSPYYYEQPYPEQTEKRHNNGLIMGMLVGVLIALTLVVIALGVVYLYQESSGNKREATKVEENYVDLGLPSGLLWATCNVGASKPEEYGDYFAWGETTPKSDCSWSTYTLGSDEKQLTKYCNDSECGKDGFKDDKTTLDLADDAAHANRGDQWRMPTTADFQELIDNTNSEWVDNYNGTGVKGRLFTASNGNSIFLPAAGYRYGTLLSDAGSYGYYWSSSLGSDCPDRAYYQDFNSGYVDVGSGGYDIRCYGHTVRPVRPKN